MKPKKTDINLGHELRSEYFVRFYGIFVKMRQRPRQQNIPM